MASKYVVIVSIILSILVVVMTGAAAILPQWYTLDMGYSTYHIGPFHVCYDYYGSTFCGPLRVDCTFDTINYGTMSLTSNCALSRSSAASLVIGGILSVASIISMFVALCAKLRGGCCSKFLPILPITLHVTALMFYIVVIGTVQANVAKLANFYPYVPYSLGASFYLAISCAGTTALSCIIYSIFGVCLRKREDETSTNGIDLVPLMNNSGRSDLQTPMMQMPTPPTNGMPLQYPYPQYQQHQQPQYPPQSYPAPYPSYYPPQVYPSIQMPQPSPYAHYQPPQPQLQSPVTQ